MLKEETLVTVYSKTQKTGTIEFLRYKDGKCQRLIYSYCVDLKQYAACCTLKSKNYYRIDDNRLPKEWMTSSVFRQQKYYKKYFGCFAENFLELSNDEKIELLEEIAKHHPCK